MVTLQHVFTLSCRMKRLVRDIADANISVTCMPITACTEFDVSKFWSMVMTVDPDMEEGEGGGGGLPGARRSGSTLRKASSRGPSQPCPCDSRVWLQLLHCMALCCICRGRRDA